MLSVSKDFVLKIVKTSIFVFCTIVLSLITSSFNFHISNIGAVSETRYFRGDTQTVNSLSAYRLSTTQSTTAQNTAHTSTQGPGNDGLTVYWGIRVWKRDSSGVETEITNEEPVAIVQRTVNGSGTQSATWTPSGTSLVSSDSIIIKSIYTNWYTRLESWV